jgi:hypothetical protein
MSLPVGVSLGDGTVILLLADPVPVSSADADASPVSGDLAHRSFVGDEL